MGISFLPNHVQLKLGLLDLVASIFTTETPHLPRFLVISEKKVTLNLFHIFLLLKGINQNLCHILTHYLLT